MCDSNKALPPRLMAGAFFARVGFARWAPVPGNLALPRPARPYSRRMLWVKALHIVFVASWFAGLFYLPRIFVNLTQVPSDSHAERERLLLMARKLYRFASFLMVAAIVLGMALAAMAPGLFHTGFWLHAKLLLVVVA